MPATAHSNRWRERPEAGSPKRSESSTAIGRVPTANTSRRIPPTPVAAPWKGSTALGWLCDSTLNAQASPPPTSTAPAFSPGPMSTRSPSVGSRRRSLRECLYAQCSDHSSENIASSTPLGVRSSFSRISSYSASVRPSSRWRGSPTVAKSGVRHDLAHLDALERDRVIRRGLDLLGDVPRRLLGLEHDHPQALVVHGPQPVAGHEPRRLRHPRDDLAAEVGHAGLEVMDGDPHDDCVHAIASSELDLSASLPRP